MFIRLLSRIFREHREPKLPLGRWALCYEQKGAQAEMKNVFANYDHCGDILCHDPKQIKNDINTIHYNSKNDSSKMENDKLQSSSLSNISN